MALSTPRRDYLGTPLLEDGAGEDPLALFMAWFQAAEPLEADATAMVLATAGRDGQPSARLVLLKELDARGLTFFTNYESRKGGSWRPTTAPACCSTGVRSTGRCASKDGSTRITAAESDEYFASRPLESRWSAWASPQSRSDREPRRTRDERVDEVRRQRFGDAVPRPASWGGYRLAPARVRVLAREAEQAARPARATCATRTRGVAFGSLRRQFRIQNSETASGTAVVASRTGTDTAEGSGEPSASVKFLTSDF